MAELTHPSQKRYPPELKARAVRMALETIAETGERQGVVVRVARQLGVGVETLRTWVKQAEIDGGRRPGSSTEQQRRLAELERENRELRRANEMARNAGDTHPAEVGSRARARHSPSSLHATSGLLMSEGFVRPRGGRLGRALLVGAPRRGAGTGGAAAGPPPCRFVTSLPPSEFRVLSGGATDGSRDPADPARPARVRGARPTGHVRCPGPSPQDAPADGQRAGPPGGAGGPRPAPSRAVGHPPDRRSRRRAGRPRPHRVLGVRGVVFQYDGRDALPDWLLHPFEQLDRCLVGVRRLRVASEPLAVHVGVLVDAEVEAGQAPQEVVAEQLFGATLPPILANVLRDGLHWTPLAEFVRRDHPARGGWHVTVPAEAFRFVDAAAVQEAVDRLQRIEGRPFLAEDCVRFAERAFGDRRLFADSPALKLLGLDVGIADPALPLLRQDVRLAPAVAARLRLAALRTLPDAQGRAGRVSAARWVSVAMLAAVGALGWSAARILGRHGRRRRAAAWPS